MASPEVETLLAQQKEAVYILTKDGLAAYKRYLKKFGILEFLNKEEKEYFVSFKREDFSDADEDNDFSGSSKDDDSFGSDKHNDSSDSNEHNDSSDSNKHNDSSDSNEHNDSSDSYEYNDSSDSNKHKNQVPLSIRVGMPMGSGFGIPMGGGFGIPMGGGFGIPMGSGFRIPMGVGFRTAMDGGFGTAMGGGFRTAMGGGFGIPMGGSFQTPSPTTEMVFSPGITDKICQMIKNASRSINIAVFMFSYGLIFEEICKKKVSDRRIDVIILVDKLKLEKYTVFTDVLEKIYSVYRCIGKFKMAPDSLLNTFDEFLKMAQKVIKKTFKNKKLGIKVSDITREGKMPGKAHEKYMIVDGSNALTGSFNFTWSAENVNYEQVVISDNVEKIVTPLLSRFENVSTQLKYQIL